MCGRFTLTVDPANLQDAFGDFIFPNQFAPRFNIAPSQPVLAIPNNAKNQADFFLWGLIPSWAKDPTIAQKLINARGETLAEKPSFRGGFKYKRCLILADGFYEWKTEPGTKIKVPHFIHMKDRKPFAFAGLWDEWSSPDGGALRTCTIITITPNKLMDRSTTACRSFLTKRITPNGWTLRLGLPIACSRSSSPIPPKKCPLTPFPHWSIPPETTALN